MTTHHGGFAFEWTLGVLMSVMLIPSVAQQVSAPAAYDISYPNRRYNEVISSLHDLDFRNLKVFWGNDGVRLKGAAFQRKRNGAYEEVHLDLLEFPGQPTDVDHAIIDLKWADCGGSCTEVGRVQVFELQANHPVLVQEIEYERHTAGTGARWDQRTNTLTITGRSNDESPNCCAHNLDVMTFRWDGKRLVFGESTRVPAVVTKSDTGPAPKE
jgi:hypothetical protein